VKDAKKREKEKDKGDVKDNDKDKEGSGASSKDKKASKSKEKEKEKEEIDPYALAEKEIVAYKRVCLTLDEMRRLFGCINEVSNCNCFYVLFCD
jgi:hypothetical protein